MSPQHDPQANEQQGRQQQPTGIPQWLEQFLNSQGGMQGLLYQVGGIQGLLQLIQQQAQQAQQPQQRGNPNGVRYGQDPTGLSAAGRAIADPYGWYDYIQQREAERPPGRSYAGSIVTGWDTPPAMRNRGNSAEAAAPYGMRNGERIPYSSLYQGDQNVVIPTMAELQARYPFMDNPLVAQGLQPLTPYFTRGQTANRPNPVNPYFDIRGQQAGDLAVGGIPDAEYEAWRAAGGLQGARGVDAIQYLPQSLRPTGTPEQVTQLRNLLSQYSVALQQTPNDPFLMQQSALANQALDYAQYGPLGQMLGNKNYEDVIKPLSAWNATPKPMGKYDYATQYGYADRTGRFPDFKNVQQTLRAAGWEPSMGFGPQESFGLLSTGQERSPEQQKMLNDLLYSISPESPRGPYGAGTEFPRFMDWQASLHPDLPKPPDPFVGMQGAINRDAYVNDTMGGGFYGGLIPEEDAINTFGKRETGGPHDPHFPTPQLRLNPMPGENRFDTYAGWAADQGAAFGTAPWAVDSPFGHAQGFDNPRRYQQPPAPGTAYPTPQFGQGGVNTFAGTQGWGNTSRNGQQNSGFGGTSSTQQQPMTFGTSPWDNPWGMR